MQCGECTESCWIGPRRLFGYQTVSWSITLAIFKCERGRCGGFVAERVETWPERFWYFLVVNQRVICGNFTAHMWSSAVQCSEQRGINGHSICGAVDWTSTRTRARTLTQRLGDRQGWDWSTAKFQFPKWKLAVPGCEMVTCWLCLVESIDANAGTAGEFGNNIPDVTHTDPSTKIEQIRHTGKNSHPSTILNKRQQG